ncbi:MAG: gliding motility-associated C-terminal domain-containing protein [Flavobacteriales bacterium]|nr:gliding motility-associated C-terminal domain-containing protein [Flavobacteriales bacterium]
MKFLSKKYLFLLFVILLAPTFIWSQNAILIFNEDFESGTNLFVADSSFGNPLGINSWITNNEYNGNGIYPNTTSQTNTVSGTIGNPNGYYLHITDTTQITNVSNTNFNPSSASDHFYVLDRSFCTLGFDSIEFSFFYLCEGSANAYAEVFYSIDGGNWVSTGNQYNSQTLWRNERIMNPAFNNVFDLRFGFRWVNASSTLANSISFGVDDIFLVGNFNQTTSPIDINITYLSDSVICQGNYLIFRYEISDTLCGGQYLIELSDANGNFANPTALWTTSMFYPNTSSTLMIQIPNWATASTCYKLRVNRISPSPQITGFASVCFEVAVCPNNIITGPTPPVVTMDTADVCVGSVIDIPFYAIGVYLPGNIFTAYLSDSSGSFANPTQIGQLPSNQTYDPSLPPYLPGTVSGIVPNVPEGCNYYIRISSSNPIANDTSIWGPFCIRNCDIETNNRQDLQFCISATAGDSALIPIDVNIPPSNVVYFPGNEFQVELLDAMSFARVNLGGLGSIAAINDTMLWVVVPDFISLSALGIQPGMYYMRIVATSSNTPGNQLGTVIRLTIGHPSDSPISISATDSLVCQGDAVTLWVSPTQQGSTYLWRLNGQVWPAVSTGMNPANAVGALFNGNAGNYNFTVQETNYGCIGPISPAFTVMLLNPPSIYVVPNAPVCFGDTVGYFVQFSPNTYYSWTAPTCGTMLDTTNNQMTIAWDQTTGQCNLQVYAINECGSNTGSTTININPLPNAFAGNDTIMCEGDSIQLTASGGNSYSWTPNNTLQNANTSMPTAFPPSTETYIVQVTDNQGCKEKDTVVVNVSPVPFFDAGIDRNIICGDSIQLNATDLFGASYDWVVSSTFISNNSIFNPIAYPIQDMYYLVNINTIEGCDVKDSLLIIVNPMLVNAGEDTIICKGASIILGGNSTSISSTIYNWTPTNSLDNPTISNPIAAPNISTNYILNVSNLLGCTNADTINIETLIYPNTDTSFTICNGFNLVLNPSNDNATYSWNTGESTKQIVVTDMGFYAVDIFTGDGCIITDSFSVIVEDCEYFFYSPTAFTPNDDGTNDVFIPITDGVDSLHFMVFNRWGEMIFESNDFTPWDGTYKDEQVMGGIYTWTAYYLGKGTYGREEKSAVGMITLIR